MEKYRNFTTITEKYLDGKLVNLSFDYESENKMHVLVSYKCNDYFTLDYELAIDKEHEEVSFLSHSSHKGIDKISLKSDPKFDQAVQKVLFA